MLDSEKATTTIEDSPAQKVLAKIDRRDKTVQGIIVLLLAVAVAFNLYQGMRLQRAIDQNQMETVEARKANISRLDETKDYIKCVLLIRYTAPAGVLTTKEGTETALDQCAASTKP